MTKFFINTRTEAWKTDVNFFKATQGQICPEMLSNEVDAPYDKHPEVSSFVKKAAKRTW